MKLRLYCLSHAAAFGIFAVLTACRAVAGPTSAFTLVSGVPMALKPAALSAAQKAVSQSRMPRDKNTLVYRGKIVSLVAVTGPASDMLSYRLGRLRNPTLIVSRGAIMKILFVNTDDDMFHNIRFGAAQKSYPNVIDAFLKPSVGTPPLSPKSETVYHAEMMTLRVPARPGRYAYFCTVRGHAQGGMRGTILVR